MHELSKMRVAVVTTYPPGKGSLNEYAYHFVRYLKSKPEVSEIILFTDELAEGEQYSQEEPGILAGDRYSASVTVKPCWKFGAKNNAFRILSEVRRAKPDVVLFNIQFASFGDGKIDATLGLLAPALVKAAGFPTIVLLHNIMETIDLKNAGFASNKAIEWAIRASGNAVTRLLLRADLVALTIPKYVEILEARYGAPNIVLAPHGTFTEMQPPCFDLPDGPRQIMTFGKFGTYKKIEILVEAFKTLSDNGRGPLELVVAGTNSPNSPNYLEDVQKQYAEVPDMRFTGYVAEEDVPGIFGDAAVVVFPYTSTTGSSGVLHQAGNYGKAVVLPNIGDFAEVISEEGYTGEFFEPTDVKSLADAIARVLDDAPHRRQIGMQNYLAARGLPIEEVVDWYVLHFQELLKKKTKTKGKAKDDQKPHRRVNSERSFHENA